jgi:hypothetical protein
VNCPTLRALLGTRQMLTSVEPVGKLSTSNTQSAHPAAERKL